MHHCMCVYPASYGSDVGVVKYERMGSSMYVCVKAPLHDAVKFLYGYLLSLSVW